GSFHHDYLLYSYYNFIKDKYKIIYDKAEKILVENGRVKGVKLLSGSLIKAERVIVTAGAWSSSLFKSLNIDIPIFPERRELYLTEDIKFFIEPLIIAHKHGIYFSQTLKGEIIGGLDEATGRGFVPLTVSLHAIIKFLKSLKSLVERVRGIGILRGWSGYYEMTPDHSHIIGQGEEWPEGLYIDAGYSGHGAMFSAYSGKILSDYIIDGKKSKYLDIFSPDRFKYGKLVEEKLVI
ncbi:MAG: FAD-binding oxidoreductase, partial [Sulfolobaceae archaeon]